MSKAEKLKKICKKIWKRIIPIIIISAIIGVILIVPKHYNKSGGVIKTAGLTLSPSYDWGILAALILGGFFLAILILVLVLNSRRKSSKKASSDKVISPATNATKEEKKKTWGQVIKMWLFIIIIVIPVTWGVGKVIWTATLGSILNTFGINTKETSASYTWKKKPHQYGYNPSKRFGGPYDAVIKKNDDSNFCFIVYGGKSDTRFYGKKKNGNISGWWEQSEPRSGGKWDLKIDNDDPTLYTGLCTDPYLPDGADIQLRLKNN